MSPLSTTTFLHYNHRILRRRGLLLLLLPLLLLFSNYLVAGKPNLIQQTCKASSISDPNINYKLCVNALQAAPASLCANLSRLGLISLRLVRDNVVDTRCYIKRLMMTTKHKVDDSALKDCKELYTDSIPDLRDATRDYKANRFRDANIKVSSVIDASTTCEDGFSDEGVASPLTKRNNVTFQLSAMALSIMKMIT
ncbi:hypothetical protein Dimus_002489 [Dionaea muscipula]